MHFQIKQESKLADSKKQLEEAKNTLDSNLPQLEEAKVKLDQAQSDLNKAKQQVADLQKGKIITLTKNESAAILSYSGNCDSISALSILFPVLFFLVAALVSMTTMTRMVEELRVQNGTLRALGYKKKDVIMQYLIYAFLATFFASSIGIVFGTYFFPSIIYYLYRIRCLIQEHQHVLFLNQQHVCKHISFQQLLFICYFYGML